MSEDIDQAEDIEETRALESRRGAPELDLPTHSVHWGNPRRRTTADLTPEERTHNRRAFGETYSEKYGRPGGVCVSYCLTPGQRRRGVRCPSCYQDVEVRPLDGSEIEPGPTRMDRLAAWAGGWVASFCEAVLYPFRVGRAHTQAVIRDTLRDVLEADLSIELDHLSDILTVLEGIEGELRAIGNAVQAAGESGGLPGDVPPGDGRYGRPRASERMIMTGRMDRTLQRVEDRRRWLDHLADCTLCPVDLCDKGVELAAAVRASMAPGETWEWA